MASDARRGRSTPPSREGRRTGASENSADERRRAPPIALIAPIRPPEGSSDPRQPPPSTTPGPNSHDPRREGPHESRRPVCAQYTSSSASSPLGAPPRAPPHEAGPASAPGACEGGNRGEPTMPERPEAESRRVGTPGAPGTPPRAPGTPPRAPGTPAEGSVVAPKEPPVEWEAAEDRRRWMACRSPPLSRHRRSLDLEPRREPSPLTDGGGPVAGGATDAMPTGEAPAPPFATLSFGPLPPAGGAVSRAPPSGLVRRRGTG